ncbi:MAG: ABC transporter ATP-binding protein [Halothermotrichaceae bacterium]
MLKLVKYLKPYIRSIVFIILLVFLQTFFQLFLPTLMANIVDIGIVNRDISYIIKMGGLMLIVAVGGVICTITASYLSAKTGTGFSKQIREKVFTRVENFSLREFDILGTSSLINRTTNDITQVERAVIMILRMMIAAPLMAVGGTIMAVSKDAKLSLIIAVAIPILMIVVYLLVNKVMPLFRLMQKKVDKVNQVMREKLSGIRVIRAFNRINYEKKRFDKANRGLTDNAIRVNKIMAVIMPLMMLMNVTAIAIIWFGGIRIENGGMQVGDLMAFLQYSMQIMFSFIMFSMIIVRIPRASASAERINEVLEIDDGVKDNRKEGEQADKQDGKPDKIDPGINPDKRGFLEFDNVSFTYFGAEEAALKNISFKAEPGEITAIIGSTGSGKSTLVNLIPRFYDVDRGNIIIEGVNINQINQQKLRSKIGLVPQKAVLFTGTVAENIRYGKKDASDKEVKKAAETAQAADFISAMDNGYDSGIAQGGNNLSGGQKQRLSIARALIRKPEIFVFDDSFSALDFKTDARLRAALKQEISESTVIIVAQRVSSVMNADRIIVLEEGEIAGIGQHKELLESCQVYQQIVYSQLSREEIS